jgi:hypothetical protein
MQDEIRRAFEAEFPIPSGVRWDAECKFYIVVSAGAGFVASENRDWERFQAGYKAALEAQAAQEPVEPREAFELLMRDICEHDSNESPRTVRVNYDWLYERIKGAMTQPAVKDSLTAEPVGRAQRWGLNQTMATFEKSEVPAGSKLYLHPPAPSPAVPEHFREIIRSAITRAKVFDDGGDGADAESARSVVSILSVLLAAESGPAEKQTRSQLPEGVTSVRNAATGESVPVVCEGVEPLYVEDLQDQLKDWTEKQFPSRTTGSILAHLRKEIDEIESDPKDVTEYSDAQMLLMDCASRNGINFADVFRYCPVKLEINKSRTWGEPNEQGFVEHVKGGES